MDCLAFYQTKGDIVFRVTTGWYLSDAERPSETVADTQRPKKILEAPSLYGFHGDALTRK